MNENTWMSEVQKRYADSYRKMIERFLNNIEEPEKKEATMQVTYNGFTGELDSLVRTEVTLMPSNGMRILYDLSIYDGEKGVTHSFNGAKLEDVKFLGGAVTFGG